MEERQGKKTWEEDMYWKHFNAFHFFLTLPPNTFHHHLVLPEKFASHMKARLPDNVSLEGPNGASWEIQLEKSNDLRFAGNGWEDFVKAHNLDENCHLMFKCTRNLGFKVLIFDKGSLCEREATYFIRNCCHTELGREDHGLNAPQVSRTEIIENEEEEDSVVFVSEKLIADDCPEARSGRNVSKQIPRKREHSPSARVGGHPSLPLSSKRFMSSSKKSLPEKNKSNRREVTEKDKEDALQRAIQEETETSFTVVLPPSAVYRRFVLTIPAAWLQKHPLHTRQSVLLRVGEKTWLTSTYVSSKKSAVAIGQLTSGWRTFALDNNLEEFDVLVFKLVSQKEEAPVVMDVGIFRVVSSTIPPSPVVN